MTKRVSLCVLVLAFGLTMLVASQAHAKVRRFGGGTAFGGGYVQSFLPVSGQIGGVVGGPILQLPTLELRFFRGNRNSLDLQIPIGTIGLSLIGSAVGGFLLLPLQVSLHHTWNFGTGGTRFFAGVGGGLDIIILSVSDVTAFGLGIRPGAQLGVEFLFGNFGLQLRLRPHFNLGFAAAASGSSSSGGASGFFGLGALVEIAFMFYTP